MRSIRDYTEFPQSIRNIRSLCRVSGVSGGRQRPGESPRVIDELRQVPSGTVGRRRAPSGAGGRRRAPAGAGGCRRVLVVAARIWKAHAILLGW